MASSPRRSAWAILTLKLERRSALLTLTGLAAALLFAGAGRAEEIIRIAVTNGPHAQIAEVAKKVAARDGLTLQIVA